MQTISLCGSLKFQNEMMEKAQELALQGNCVLTPTYQVKPEIEITDEQMQSLKQAHFKRIDFSDAIYVVNVNGYIGESTKQEIDYAKKLGKAIYYFTEDI